MRSKGLGQLAGRAGVRLAVVPFVLSVLALLDFLHLDEVWARDVAPDVRRAVSGPIYQVVDDAVRRVLTERQLFWLTAGAAIAASAEGEPSGTAAGT